jgi:hypothetical protein
MSGLWSGSPGLWSGNPGLWGGYTGLSGGGGLWGGGFSPATLFAMGEQGYWLDPSDFTTMFQDSAGATPVTAVGQNVGLILDKSRGAPAALGPELVTNGTFDADTDWTKVAGAVISGGTASYSGTTITFGVAVVSQNISVVAGRTYLVSYTVSSITGIASVQLGTVQGVFANAPVSRTEYITATATGSVSISIIARGAGLSQITIDNISVRELPGNHFIQSSLASRPVLQQDTAGNYFLLFDGSDDFLVSAATINPGAVDKAQVFAGVRKLSDVATAALIESNASTFSNPGAFIIQAPSSGGTPNYLWRSRGSGSQVDASYTNAAVSAPITNILTGLGDIAAPSAILRVNGTQVASSTADQGTGNYLTYLHYIGRRGGTSLPFNGRIYQMITRFGPNLTSDVITQSEAFVAQRTGFTAPDIQGVPTIS